MRLKATYILFLMSVGLISIISLADSYRVSMHIGQSNYAVPTDSIKCITFNEQDSSFVMCNDSTYLSFANIDSITHEIIFNDTLYLQYADDHVIVQNPRADILMVNTNQGNADVTVHIRKGLANPIVQVSGNTDNGRLRIDSDVDYTVRFDGISMNSTHAPTFNSTTKQKVTIELAEGTENILSDSKKYIFTDTLEEANGCFNSTGAVTFKGKGMLNVTGKSKHAIYSKKSITFNDGTYIVESAASDAIHSGKSITVKKGTFNLSGMQGEGFDMDEDFTMTGGEIEMNITGEAAKGIKCAGIMTIDGGKITATASGALKNKKGDLSYCTILKCDSNIIIKDGNFHLVNNSPGGKCISADHNLTIEGGTIYAETKGDGAAYTNTEDSTDYYTSKCIAADDSVFIHRGNIQCLSTGIGGKGIVADEYMEIGLKTDTEYTEGPTIIAETTDSSIVNDIDEDKRYGCPKAIKVNNLLNIYSGNIHCTTAGMGGEGVECNNEMYVYGGNIECNCYDDGFNVGNKLVINGGQIYCNSVDNDGIDSNGSMYLNGGIVASVNQTFPDESFDAESKQLYLNGAIVFGIGSSSVKLNEQECCFYNTILNSDPSKPIRRGLCLTNGKYIYIMKGDRVILALKNGNQAYRAFVTVSSPEFEDGEEFRIAEGDEPSLYNKTLFDGKCLFGGYGTDTEIITDIITSKNVQQ